MTTKLQKLCEVKQPSATSLLLAASLLFATCSCGALPACAEDGAQTSVATDASGIDPAADKVIHKVSDFYKGMNSMSAIITADTVVEKDGQKHNTQSTFDVKVLKPNSFSFSTAGGPMGGTVKTDGNKQFLYSPQLGMYMTGGAPSDFAQLFAKPEFAFLSGGFSGLSLLEALVSSDPYSMIVQGVTGANLVGSEKIDGVDTQHLHFMQKDLSWDLWVDQGALPWVRRVIPDVGAILKNVKGPGQNIKMDLTINYKDLQQNPTLAKADFAFTPPSGAKEVPSFFRSAQQDEEEHPLANKPAPAINLDTLKGDKFDLSSFKGKDVVVLDFWATWCPPCRRALPILADVTKSYASKDVVFYAVDEQEDAAKIQDYLKSQTLDINVALDKKGEAGEAYHVTGIPQSVIIGKDGVVHVIHIGFAPDLKQRLTAELDAIIAGKEPPPEH